MKLTIAVEARRVNGTPAGAGAVLDVLTEQIEGDSLYVDDTEYELSVSLLVFCSAQQTPGVTTPCDRRHGHTGRHSWEWANNGR